jgi:hypothetical protein
MVRTFLLAFGLLLAVIVLGAGISFIVSNSLWHTMS